MAQGEGGGGHFADSGGYGGNFGGAGGASRNTGSEHGILGYGGMSPGGYNSTTYARNKAGIPGTPGFGARRAAAQRARQKALQKARKQQQKARQARKGKGLVKKSVLALAPVLPQPKPVRSVFDYTDYRAPYNPAMGPPRPGYAGYGTTDNFGQSTAISNINSANYDPLDSIGTVTNPGPYLGQDNGPGTLDPNHGAWGNLSGFGNAIHNAIGTIGNAITGGNRRQFGGPVAPGQQYTVGENGPETLQMNAQGGGQVFPHNPMDRMRGPMGPGMGGGMQRPPIQRPMMPQWPQGMGGFPGRGGMQQPPMQSPQMPSHQQLTPEQIQQIQAWRASRPDRPDEGMGGGGGMRPEMMAWRDARPDRPEGQMTPEQMMAFRTSIQDWRGDRPEMGGMGGPGSDWQQAISAWRDQRPDFMQGGGMNRPMQPPNPIQRPVPPQRPFRVGGDLRRRHFMEMARRGVS